MDFVGDEGRREPELEEWLALTLQSAINAVGVRHAQDPGIDITAEFRREMARRGIEVDDDEWVEDLEAIIHEGRWAVVDVDEERRELLGWLRPWTKRGRGPGFHALG